MFKINKSLRRLGIVSASALMLLGVGATAMGSANAPVHADVSNAQIMNSSYANSIPKVDIEQEKAEAQNELNDAKKHPSNAEGDLVNVKEDTDIYDSDAKLRKIVNQDWKKLHAKSAVKRENSKSAKAHKYIKRHNYKAAKRNRRTDKRVAKRAIKGIDSSHYARALRKSNHVLRHGRRHATRYVYREAKKFTKANNAEKKAYRKFARKHTNRNRKAVNKAITKLSNVVNALLK